MQQQPIRIEQRSGPNILIRVIYFFVFGLWFSGIWAAIGWMDFVCDYCWATGWAVDAQSDAAGGHACPAAK